MNTKRPQLLEDPTDRIIREAVRADMERIYGEERRSEPRKAPAVPQTSIFLRRQAE